MVLPADVDVYETGWPYTGGRAILAHLESQVVEFTVAWADRDGLVERALRIVRERAASQGANAVGINGPLDLEMDGDLIRCKLSALFYLLENQTPEQEAEREAKAELSARRAREAREAAAAAAQVVPPDHVHGEPVVTEAHYYGPWYGGA